MNAIHPVFAELEDEIRSGGEELLNRRFGFASFPPELAELAWCAAATADELQVPLGATDPSRFADWIGAVADVIAGEYVASTGEDGPMRLALACPSLADEAARLMACVSTLRPEQAAASALHELLFDLVITRFEHRLAPR